jgi:hypothetical protein
MMGNDMGYRSNVAYTIRFTFTPQENEEDARNSFYVFLAEAKTKFPTAFGDECLKVDEENYALNFFAENVKWYEDYDDVKCHEGLVDLAREWCSETDVPFKGNNQYIGGIFMRIGEETDDIVEDYFGEYDYQWMNISRSIFVDWTG